MLRFIKILTAVVVLILGLATGAIYLFVRYQGLSSKELKEVSGSHIDRDPHGVLLIKGSDWLDSIEAQGFAVASERFFQMDLLRRKADGALAELFGKSALPFDKIQRLEDWRHYATTAYQTLPQEQRDSCDRYARGVNRFLDENPHRAGIEYAILSQSPKSWSCTDSLMIILTLSDNMSRSWTRDMDLKKWYDALPRPWFNFLFPKSHPWNEPIFSSKKLTDSPPSPLPQLPAVTLQEKDFELPTTQEGLATGASNSWAYRGSNGAWLANDPHLSNTVPQFWMPVRLDMDTSWIVGASVPGIPGVLIGMNPHLAWSITNSGEDVDDAIMIRPESVIYKKTSQIIVRGETPVDVEIRRSNFGPVVKELNSRQLVVRRWLALQDGVLNLPGKNLNFAKDWDSFNAAIDEFKFVPLNFTMLDRSGNMGLRLSGCDFTRTSSGMIAGEENTLKWLSPCSTHQRKRLYKPYDSKTEATFIETANERLWIDEELHNFSDDDRAQKIREFLKSSDHLTLQDMRILQLNTTSKFFSLLLKWLVKNGNEPLLPPAQLQQWQQWDGDSRSCPLCMAAAHQAFSIMEHVINQIFIRQYSTYEKALPIVKRDMKRSRILMILENPSILPSMGVSSNDLAAGILKLIDPVKNSQLRPWHERNKMAGQHPFVGRIPFIDQLFQIQSWPQYGSGATVRAERPNHGPSMRVIFNPAHPEESLWAFPIGSSGHPLSSFYQNWSSLWQSGGMTKIP